MTRRPRPRGRGRLSSIELMPRECDGVIAWAAQELAGRERTQRDIYAEFVQRCEELMADSRGELEFDIPSPSSFHRYTVRLAQMTRRLEETREIVAAISSKFDAKDSDDLTVMLGETLKSVVLHMLVDAADGDMTPQGAMFLASAFKQAVQAQTVSSDRRRKLEKEFAANVGAAVDAAGKARGLTAETTEKIKADILGVSK